GAHRVNRVQVKRIASGHDERVAVAAQRENAVAVDDLKRECGKQVEVDFDASQIDQFQPQGLGDGGQRFLFVSKTEFGRCPVQSAVGGLRLAQSLELLRVEQTWNVRGWCRRHDVASWRQTGIQRRASKALMRPSRIFLDPNGSFRAKRAAQWLV